MAAIIRNTGEKIPNRFRALFLAPPGEGKTTLCATLSEFMPKERPVKFPLASPVELKDILWINIDGGAEHGGLDSLAQSGIRVDYIDLSQMTGQTFMAGLGEALKACEEATKAGTKTTFVVDSISVMDKIMLGAVLLELETAAGGGSRRNKDQIWDLMLARHTRIALAFRKLPGNVLFTFHEKYIGEAHTTDGVAVDAVEAKRRADGQITGTADLDLSGRIRTWYVANSSYVITIGRNRLPGGKEERYITTKATDVFTKQRTHKLADKEPFDLRLLVDKLNS